MSDISGVHIDTSMIPILYSHLHKTRHYTSRGFIVISDLFSPNFNQGRTDIFRSMISQDTSRMESEVRV